MFKRLTVVIAMVVALLATTIPNANASLSTGACVITLNFNFNGSVGLLSSPSYNFSGGGTCGATLSNPATPTTNIFGSGGSTQWNCAGVVASGSWAQSFSSDIPGGSGSFILAGANGAYDLTVTATPIIGKAQLTTVDAVGVGLCPLNGVDQLTLVGVMEFQDP